MWNTPYIDNKYFYRKEKKTKTTKYINSDILMLYFMRSVVIMIIMGSPLKQIGI
jgi:hypothetical protein